MYGVCAQEELIVDEPPQPFNPHELPPQGNYVTSAVVSTPLHMSYRNSVRSAEWVATGCVLDDVSDDELSLLSVDIGH